MRDNKNYEIVVGIDFGSSSSGFAYSFMNEDDINHGDIIGANVDNKVPTEIILDDNNNILQFGANCVQFLREKGLDTGHYFKGIKMHLYSHETFIKSSNSEKSLPLKLVIQKVLEKLKELALEELKKIWKDINESRIKWVVTVPAIWENFQKSIMFDACKNAGLINENTDESLFFALEPEAASLYCSRNPNIKQEYLLEGKYYIICDLGGGTGDIVSHMVGSNKHLEEITASCGGDYGSNQIDNNIFNDIIYNLFGYRDFNSLLQKFKQSNIKEEKEVIFDGWSELERQIRDFKHGATLDKKNEKFPINCSLFQDFFDDDKEISDLVDKYNNFYVYNENLKLTIKSKKKWIIEFPYKIIENYIEIQATKICDVIRDILLSSNKKIDTIIFVGGYCSNNILTSSIKNQLQGDIIHFLQPTKPCLAIMEGAVLFGINPNIINLRIAKYTIGQATRNIWDEEKHSRFGKKVFDEEDKVWRCEDCFDKYIEVKEKVKLGQEIIHSYRMVGPRYTTFRFYQSINTNPVFIFENGVKKIGECKLDAKKDYPFGQRDVKVKLTFGGTYIGIKAWHIKSGEEINKTLIFDS